MLSLFMTEEPRIYDGEKIVPSVVLGKLDSHMQKNKAACLSYPIHKNQLKIHKRSEYKV